ncbi:isoprenoid synthase domain-containing protein [Xylogone sp. PMI_703]|nr:isoprenoid synthase domain-containing protein [Xylogone sp. PMI_703]
MDFVTKEEYEHILSSFLADIDFEMPSWGYDHSLEQPVMEYFRGQPWEHHLREKAVGMAKWMSTGLGMCYPFVDKEGQVSIAIFATYVLFIDDIAPQHSDTLREFQQQVIRNQPQKSAILQSLLDFLPSIEKLFGPYASAMITKSTIEFVYGCYLENKYDGIVTPPSGAHNFPAYFRQKTGYAEPHAHFAFPQALYPEEQALHKYLPIISDLCDLINYGNDILSFYKETIVGPERLNFICNYSNVYGISVAESLRLTCSSVTQNICRIQKVLSVDPEMSNTTSQFIHGYIAWYINQDRYKLSDLRITSKKGVKIQRTERVL